MNQDILPQKTLFNKLKQFSCVLLVFYLALALALPILMGEQLYLRQSRSNYSMAEATNGTGELVAGSDVEQTFTTDIHRLENISVLWATYNRQNSGTVYVELLRESDRSLLMSQALSAAEITNGYISNLVAEPPLDGLAGVPLVLRLFSPDSVNDSAVSPMMSSTSSLEKGSLMIDGKSVGGVLCFTAQGSDYIWTGLHYWQFAALGGLMLVVLCAITLWRIKNGKNCIVLNTVVALGKYRFLIRQLVSRDFKTKYKRSVLGILWSFLNPLLTMLVQYMVFSNVFRFDVDNYPVYLLSGVILFNFFSEACSMTLTSIVGNASLITKVYVPKYIYPLTRTLSCLVNLLMSLIPLFLVALLSGLPLTKAYFLLPIPLVCLTVFSLGVGMVLASSMVFFRDTQFLWGVLIMIWMYLTPIFYPASILPDNIAWVLNCNPMYYFITFIRTLIIDGVSPEPIAYFQCFVFAIASLLVGSLIFKKSQDKFVLYL